MTRDWESTFSTWAQSPGKTEQDRCEHAETAVRNAIAGSTKLNWREVQVFTQGSYKNRVNVRRESDVDVGVCCKDVFFADYPPGTTQETFRNTDADYTFSVFKDEVEEALVAYFGRRSVHRGNKAFDVKENSYRVDADVAPFFEHRRYQQTGSFITGVELLADDSPAQSIINWPEQHYDNGVAKNKDTRRRYKAVVRILKSLRNEMEEAGNRAAIPVPGFLIECLVWSAPNESFAHSSFQSDVRSVLAYLFNHTMNDEDCWEWGEVSELKYLFRNSQPWTRGCAHTFLGAAWDYIGFD